jgi:hypothetical protein
MLSFQRFLGFMELFSLRKIRRICPRHCGPGPLALAHGSMNFIKRWALASGSTAQIDPSEPLSQLLISVVHHRSDGRGGWLQSGRRGLALTVARRGRAWRLTGV